MADQLAPAAPPEPQLNGSRPHVRVAIVGTGFAGLGLAIRLKQQGMDDFVLLERADDVGGTWRDNTYPGCQCDVPSNLYSFSFAPNPNWSRTFSPQQEIWDYLRDCAHRYDLIPHIRFGHELLSGDWDEERQLWEIETAGGSLTADVVVAGMGGLSEPAVPDIPGLDTFPGNAFHSAQWDHDDDLTGKRVAVIGTGASAIQIVPNIQPQVGQLYVFQRTPPWVVPHNDRPTTPRERRLYRRFPALQKLVRAGVYWSRELLVLGFAYDPRIMKLPERLARRHLEEQVADPELRAKLTPDYRIGCKRILPSNNWYPALQKPNVELLTGGLREIRGSTLVSGDGSEREVDTIVFGTGFQATEQPIASRVRGREGILLDHLWRGSPQAYLGTTIAGFPNLFVIVGPNTGLGHTSIVFIIESQINYVLDCLRTMDERGIGAVEVRPEAQMAFNERIQHDMQRTVWTNGGCQSWYIDRNGRNTTLWPGFTWDYRQKTRRFDPAPYELRERRRAPARVYA